MHNQHLVQCMASYAALQGLLCVMHGGLARHKHLQLAVVRLSQQDSCLVIGLLLLLPLRSGHCCSAHRGLALQLDC